MKPNQCGSGIGVAATAAVVAAVGGFAVLSLLAGCATTPQTRTPAARPANSHNVLTAMASSAQHPRGELSGQIPPAAHLTQSAALPGAGVPGGWPRQVALKNIRGFLFAETSVNGRDPVLFLVDTGCNQDVVAADLAKAWRLPICGAGYAVGAGGRQDARYHLIKRLDVGPMALNPGRIASMDLSRFDAAFGIKVAGVISFQSLKQWPFTLDYAAGTLTFHDPSQRLGAEAGEIVPFREINGLPMIAMRLANQRWVSLVIDSGGDQPLVLPRVAQMRWPELFDQREFETVSIAAIGGPVEGRRMYLEEAALLGRKLSRVTVSIEDNPAGFSAGQALVGRMGHPVLEHCTLSFDAQQQKVFVKWRE